MNRMKRMFLKLSAAAVGAATLVQFGGCNVQFPPDNTECIPNFGVCIAWPEEGFSFGSLFTAKAAPAESGD